ncbi:flavin reductase family protein [candidate division KSB1 bacterium]|nr:flavin reductase family protein [candidate division KSB1 bacterium]
MPRKIITYEEFTSRPIDLWLNQWLLLTCGDFNKKHYNTMTVAWGSIGGMWNKPFVQAVVRPTRYTYEFMEQYDTFTLCAFPPKFRSDLQYLGTRSGRDSDKISDTKLSVIRSSKVAAPCFEEAELIIECKKIYVDNFKPDLFQDEMIEKNYPKKDYHRVYFGEILAILGDDKYSAI